MKDITAGHGAARLGMARQGMARLGMARQGMARLGGAPPLYHQGTGKMKDRPMVTEGEGLGHERKHS